MKINRCPKCGRAPSVFIEVTVVEGLLRMENAVVKVRCCGCGLHVGDCETRDEAVAKWNKMTKGEKR